MIHAAFLIPLLPLVGFAVLAPLGRRLGNPVAGWIATLLVAASFVVTILVFIVLATTLLKEKLEWNYLVAFLFFGVVAFFAFAFKAPGSVV